MSTSPERPLGGYAVLSAGFGGAVGGALVALRATGKPLPKGFGIGDVLLGGVATHKLSRLLAKDKVTSFLRAPFTEYQGPGGPGEVEEKPRGSGLRYVVGELLMSLLPRPLGRGGLRAGSRQCSAGDPPRRLRAHRAHDLGLAADCV